MKVRTGFITNSSSSNFIIAFKSIDDHQSKYANMCKRIIDVILSCTGYETNEATIVTDVYEYNKIVKEWYGFKDETLVEIIEDNEMENIYNEVITYLNQGYSIAIKRIGNDDLALEKIVKAIAENNDDFILLESD